MTKILNIYYVFVDNLDYYAFLGLIFMAVAMGVVAIALLSRRRNVVSDRLSRLLPAKKATSTSKPKLVEEEAQGLVAKVTKPLYDIIAPDEEALKKRLRLKLVQSGFRSEQAMRNYLAAKIVLALLLPGAYLLVTMAYRLTPDLFLICFVFAFLGYFLPNVILLQFRQARQAGITKALPDALDLMVVCVEAGLGLDMTFKRTGEEIRPVNKDLSDEFFLTNLEIRAGRTRDESFKNMALRTGVPEIHNLMTILIQTSRFGTSVAQALRVHADAMRVKRRQIAEEKAAKAAVKLIFPLILFIFPALLIVLAGPAAIKIVQALFPVFGG